MPTNAPTFNLKAVVRETGLKPDTIRAWERRYGLPHPKRTAGGHRLYSQHDINLLKWMNARQHEGLSASRIAELWKSLEADGTDPLQATTATTTPASAMLNEIGELSNLRREWVYACEQFSEMRAEQVTAQAFALFPLESVVVDVLMRGLAEIGEKWYQGEVTVQQEHFASMLVLRRLQALIVASPAPTRTERIVLACPPEEQHIISAQVLNLFLRRQGWEVIDLGANVPLDRLEKMLKALHPHLVIVPAQHLPTAQTLQVMAEVVIKLQVPLAFGGGVFNRHPTLQQHISGHFLGEKLADIIPQVQRILQAPWPVPSAIAPEPECAAAVEHYNERLSRLEADLLQQFDPSIRTLLQRSGANGYLAQYITAALHLGDINLLGVDMEWIKGLIWAHHMPDAILHTYLQAYLTAAQQQLDQRGAIIIDWLQRTVAELSIAPE